MQTARKRRVLYGAIFLVAWVAASYKVRASVKFAVGAARAMPAGTWVTPEATTLVPVEPKFYLWGDPYYRSTNWAPAFSTCKLTVPVGDHEPIPRNHCVVPH